MEYFLGVCSAPTTLSKLRWKSHPRWMRGLPPLRLHTGTDEILLDDSRRYAQNARAANVDIALHLWEGMPHVFATTVGSLNAATQALDLIGTFLRERLDVR